MKISIDRVLLSLFVLGSLPGCKSSTCLAPGPRHQEIMGELVSISPYTDPLPARTPVIDVHVHTFNTRYLPLEGILLGKRDAFPPVTWLISDHGARVIAADLASRTQLAPFHGQKGFQRSMEDARVTMRGQGLAPWIFSGLINLAIEEGAWDYWDSPEENLAAIDRMIPKLTLSQKLALNATSHMMGMDEHTKGKGQTTALRTILLYLWTLTQSDARMIDLYRRFHKGTRHAGEIRVVSHMMDLAPVYNQFPDGRNLLDFEKEQLARTRAYTQQQTKGATYFVAYNPYRDHWNGGRPGDALRLVQQAVRHYGATGVKVYPPSGYRAAGNVVQGKPNTTLTNYPNEQWHARYGEGGEAASRQLDDSLEKLLSWCTKEQVPVFTHCGHGEFEARKDYGVIHADPEFWEEYLKTHPEADGSPCKLKLCLAHAGGGDYWFGCGDYSKWGERVARLCMTYPNVYCEVTSDVEVLKPDKKAFFVERISGLIKDSCGKPGYHDFGTKILYGTDWPQPDAGGPKAVLESVQTCLLHKDLRRYYARYFHENAERYLGRKL